MRRYAAIIRIAAGVMASAIVPLAVLGAGPEDAYAGGAPAISWASPPNSGSYDYGAVTPGQATTQDFVLTNSGGSSSAALTVALTGSTAFSITADSCSGTAIGKNKSCVVTVQYTPTAAGANDSATLTANGQKAAARASIALSGSGAGRAELGVTVTGPAFAISPGSLFYTVTITNVGTVPATNATVTDATPVGTTFGSEAETPGPIFACVNPGHGTTGTTSCTISVLAAGASATFDIADAANAHIPSGSTITNSASVGADGALSKSASVTTTIEAPV